MHPMYYYKYSLMRNIINFNAVFVICRPKTKLKRKRKINFTVLSLFMEGIISKRCGFRSGSV